MTFARTLSSLALALGLAALIPLARPPTSPPVNASAQRKLAKSARGQKLGRAPHRIKDSMQYWTGKRRNARGELPVQRYIAARERVAEMRGGIRGGPLPAKLQMRRPGAPAGAARFTGLAGGRAPVIDGWGEQGPGNIGGRTRALVVQGGGVLYAAGVTGGIWKSTNDGASWTHQPESFSNLSVSTLAADPKDANTLYAGTGELFTQFRGAGIFKTTDGGKSWNQLASTANFDFHFVQKVIASPNAAGVVYAATNTGLWRSGDGGATWALRRVGTFTDLALLNNAGADNLFAWQSFDLFGVSGTVYRSLDGILFAESSAGIPTGHARGSFTVPGATRAYCAVAGQDGRLVGFYESSDNGATWVQKARLDATPTGKLNALLFSNAIFGIDIDGNGKGDCPPFPLDDYGQGFYDNVIASHPSNPDRVWLGGVDLWRSDDRGATWGLAAYWWLDDLASPRYVHADHHAIEFHPSYDDNANTTVYFGNDGGLARTTNGTAPVGLVPSAVCTPFPEPAVTFQNINNGYGVTQFYHGSVSTFGNVIFGGTQDNGTLRAPVSGTSWSPIFGGDGGFTAIDPNDERVLYGETQGLGFFKSIDGGATVFRATDGITERAGNFSFIAPFAMDPTNPQRLWIGGRQVFRTTDGAASWSAASAPDLTSLPITAWGIPPSGGGNVVYLAAFEQVFRSTDALSPSPTWTRIDGGLPRICIASSIGVHPTDAARVFVSYSNFDVPGGQVYATSDGLADVPTWTSSVGTAPDAIPNIPVHHVLVNPSDPSVVLAATDSGVLASGDGGESWSTLNGSSLPNTIVEHLVFRAPDQLYAFTHGRGVFRTTLEPALLTLAQPNGGERLRPGLAARVSWNVNPNQPRTKSITGFKLQRSTNDGASYQDVATLGADARSFQWTPTRADRATRGRVRIVALAEGAIVDQDASNNPFSVNARPVARARDARGLPKGSVTLTAAESADADGDALSFRWAQVAGPPVKFDTSAAAPVVSLADVAQTTALRFKVTASDGEETSEPAEARILINRPPDAASPATVIGTAGGVVAHQLAATDPDGDALTVVWKQTGGTKVKFDETNPRLSFTAPGGTLTFQPDVSDGLETTTGGVITFQVRGVSAAGSGGGGGGGCRAGQGGEARADFTLALMLACAAFALALRAR